MFGYLLYLLTLLKLKFVVSYRKLSNRFDKYSAGGDIANEQVTGLIISDFDWHHACPNLDRKENINLIASNTFDRTALRLSLKWRPNSAQQVTTLLTKLSIELDGLGYDYDTASTYKPTHSTLRPTSTITQYGSNGSSVKLFVLDPLRRYRLVFRGQMRRRDDPNEVRFVKLNCIVFTTSKVYDFQQQFDAESLAKQYAAKQSRKASVCEILDQFVLINRFEQTVRFHGELMIRESPEKRLKRTIYLWGFHTRHFVGEHDQKLRSKRILAHFANGRMFHVAACESIDQLGDPNGRFSTGYGCFRIGPAISDLNWVDESKSVDWTKIGSSTTALNFHVAAQARSFKIDGTKRGAQGSQFSDLTMVSSSKSADDQTVTAGWAYILVNDAFDTSEEQFRMDKSLRDYQRALESGLIVNPKLFDTSKDFPGKPLIVDIDERDCQYPGLVGSKASSLAQLKAFVSTAAGDESSSSANYSVPTAIVLTKFVYEAIQNANPNLRDAIKSLEARVGRGDLVGLDKECERLQEYFKQEVCVPGELKMELERRLKQSFAVYDVGTLDGQSFAVRSSSWGEDEDDMSAAGQLTTVLNVTTFDKLIEAILECFASKFGHTNIEYKRQHGLPLDLPMAVVIQRMVDCEKAGVVFTCDPASGDESSLIVTANYGLGESVVSAQADPDTIRVAIVGGGGDGDDGRAADARLEIAEVKVGEKKVIITADENSNLTVDRSKCCLAEHEIIGLSKCCLRLVRYFGGPRDIEWGWFKGQLHLLQSRPITGLDAFSEHELLHEHDMASRAELEFATRANVGEVMPFAMSPLEMSYSMKFWPVITDKIFSKILPKRPEDYAIDCSPDFIMQSYHTFFGLRGKAFINFAGKPDQRPLIARAMEIGLFGHEVNDQELSERATEMVDDYRISLEQLKFNYYTFANRYMPFKLNRDCKKLMARLRRDVHSLRFANNSDSQMEGLRVQLKAIFVEGNIAMENHLIATFISSKMNFDLMQLLSKYCQDPTKLYAALSKILGSCPDVLSAQIPRRINKMAKLIAKNNDQKTLEEFVSMTPKEALKFVSRDLRSPLAKEFDEFMVTFGHRCYHEFEISSVAWRDKPEEIAETLQSNVRSFIGKRPDEIDESEPPKRSLGEVIDSLGIKFSWLDRLRLRYIHEPRCQTFVSVREQTKDIMIEFCDIQRDATRLLARELRQNNRLPDEDLLYYINYTELAAITRDPQPALVMHASRRRKLFKRMFAQAWRFEEIIRGYEMLPLHLKQAQQMDEKLANASRLYGTTASSGQVRAKVCIVNGYSELNKVEPGDILVTYSTDIAFSPIFPLISGVVTEIGGLISHGAVVAREYGLPSVIGIENATTILKHGEEILLDADNGAIVRLSIPQNEELQQQQQ